MTEAEEFEFRRRLELELDTSASAPQTKSPSYIQGRDTASGASRGLLSVLNGPTMGFGDELLGAIGGAYDTVVKGGSMSDNYRDNRDYVRGAQDVERQVNPWMTGISQMAAAAPLGALRLFGGAAAATKPVGILSRMGQSAKIGAGYGGLSGAGNSTGESVGAVAADAAKGAATGAALGSAIVPAGAVVGAVGGNVAQRVSDSAAANYAREKIAEALVRDGRGTVVQSAQSNPITQAAARLTKLGTPAVVADSGGSQTRELLDLLAMLPGKTKDAAAQLLRDRKVGSAGRMIGAADDALGVAGARLSPTIDALVTSRAAAAAPLYSKVHAVTIAAPSAELQAIVTAADRLGATKFGQKIATARQQPYGLDAATPTNWAMRDLDHVKQGLDQLIAKQWDEGARRITPLGASYQQLKNKLVAELDQNTIDPVTGQSIYKAARDAFAGPSALMDAARAGNAAVTQNEARIAQSVAGMTGSELQAFRVGAYEALREKIGRSTGGRTELMNMAENPAIADKLKIIFGGNRPFREFAANVEKERILKLLQGTNQGSKTAARQYAAGDLDVGALQDAGGAVASAAGGNMATAASKALNVWNRVKTPESVRNQMGAILLSGGPIGQNQLAQMLQISQQINARQAQQANMLGPMLAKPAGSWFLD